MNRFQRIHTSTNLITFDPQFDYHRELNGFKPKGFWYSWDGPDSWEQWCHSEDFRMDDQAYRFAVEIPSTHNVLQLSTPEDLLKFSKQYCHSERYLGCDWQRVQQAYDGIEIFPYQWSLRLNSDTFWYYGWDCASGCVWNLNGVRLDLITPRA